MLTTHPHAPFQIHRWDQPLPLRHPVEDTRGSLRTTPERSPILDEMTRAKKDSQPVTISCLYGFEATGIGGA